jgi:hypothetical protein
MQECPLASDFYPKPPTSKSALLAQLNDTGGQRRIGTKSRLSDGGASPLAVRRGDKLGVRALQIHQTLSNCLNSINNRQSGAIFTL